MEDRQIGRALILAAVLLGGVAEVQAQTALRPGVKGGSDEQGEYISYKNGQPNEPYRNPVSLYKQMFANLVPSASSAVPSAAPPGGPPR